MSGWVLEEARLRVNSAPVGLSLAGAGAELGKKKRIVPGFGHLSHIFPPYCLKTYSRQC